MNSPDLVGQLAASGALLAAQIALSAAIDRGAVARTAHDPTTIDLLLRLHLSPDSRLRAVDLCNQLMKSPSHISRMLDRAAAAGLVEREPDPNDRRANRIALTDEGQGHVESFIPDLTAVLEEVIHNTLSPADIETLVALLGRIELAGRECAAAKD